MADYTTSSAVKTLLGIADSTWDTDIGRAVTTASVAIDAFCNRSFSQDGSATAKVFRPQTWETCPVVDISTTTGLVVKTDDDDDGVFETTWSSTDYELEPLNGLNGPLVWPYTRVRAVGDRVFPMGTRRSPVQVTARWGWAAIPSPVVQSALHLTVDLWKRKDATWGLVGSNEFGAVRISQNLYSQVAGLLAPYVLEPYT